MSTLTDAMMLLSPGPESEPFAASPSGPIYLLCGGVGLTHHPDCASAQPHRILAVVEAAEQAAKNNFDTASQARIRLALDGLWP